MLFRSGADLELLYPSKLALHTPKGPIFDDQLLVYTTDSKLQLNASFQIQNNTMSFDIALPKDLNETYIIDPLVYSTFVGGSGTDYGYNIAVDNAGFAYVAAYTSNNNFPLTPGSYSTFRGGMDCVIYKMNQTGTGLVYSTYVGSTSTDYAYGIAVDSSGCAYFTGYTSTSNYPVTAPNFNTFPGNSAVIVTKLNPSGNALIYSKMVGGTSLDRGYGIAVDQYGNAYVTGFTASTNFPTRPSNAYQRVHRGGSYDVIVFKFNPAGTDLVFSTFVGGTGTDYGYAIAVDSNPNNVYVTGSTSSNTFPRIGRAHGGGTDAIVFKLRGDGTQLLYSSYLGGSSTEIAYDIALNDTTREVYVTGYTASANFPVTVGAYQTIRRGGNEIFVTKFNDYGTSLLYSTLISTPGSDMAYGIAIDSYGCAYVTGSTNNNTYPTTPDAYQTIHSAGQDGFVSKLNPFGSVLLYSTYIPGNSTDQPYSIAIDANNDVFITGWTQSTANFPITPGAFQATHRGGVYDCFVQKIHIPVYLDVFPPKNPSTDRWPNRLLIQWEQADAGTNPIEHYEIHRSLSNDFSQAVLVQTIAADQALQWWDEDIDNQTAYYYFLVTVDTLDNESSASPTSSFPVMPPLAPTGSTAIPYWNKIDIEWNSSIQGDYPIVSYRIRRGSTSNVLDAKDLISLNSEIIEYEDLTPSLNADYYYFIQAIDERGFVSALWAISPPTRLLSVFLKISAELSRKQFQHGDEVYVLMTVYNYGNSPATDVKLSMTIPSEIKFLRADRYRSIILTPSIIEFEIGYLPKESVQTFQIDLKVDAKVSQDKNINIFFDVDCSEKSKDSTRALLIIVPQRSGAPDIYIGLYYLNAHFDPHTGTVYIPTDTPLEVDFRIHGARMPYHLSIDWGDGEIEKTDNNKDSNKILKHTYKTSGKKQIKFYITDANKKVKEANISISVK